MDIVEIRSLLSGKQAIAFSLPDKMWLPIDRASI